MPPKRPAAKPAPQVTLYESPYSHYCVKVHKLLDYKGVPFASRHVAYHDKRELLQATGQDYIPWLQWGGEGVAWGRIADFVEAKVPEPTLFPEGTRGPSRIAEQWAHDVLEERAWRVALPDMPGTFRDDVERWVFEEMQERKRGPIADYKAKQPQFLADLGTHLAFLEESLDGRDHLLADAPSLADFAVYGALAPLAYVGRALPKEFPRTRAWHQRVGKL